MQTQFELFPRLPLVRDPATHYQRYKAYLRSSFWKYIRKQTLELADYLCQARKPGCTEIATEVHHTTYLVWNGSGDLPGKTTIAICRNCHSWIHSHPIMTPDPANDNEAIANDNEAIVEWALEELRQLR